jgi:hypothetical protein
LSAPRKGARARRNYRTAPQRVPRVEREYLEWEKGKKKSGTWTTGKSVVDMGEAVVSYARRFIIDKESLREEEARWAELEIRLKHGKALWKICDIAVHKDGGNKTIKETRKIVCFAFCIN